MSTFQYDQNASFAILDNFGSFGEFQTLKIGNIFNFDILEEALESQFQAIIQVQNFKCWQT